MIEALRGARAVLAGVDLTNTDRANLLAAWRAVSGAGLDAQLKVLDGFLGGRDPGWPWFDDCRSRFEQLGRFPDLPGWADLEPGVAEPEPATPEDALAWIDIAQARALLADAGVRPAGRKNADIWEALASHVPFERWRPLALASWRDAEAARIAGPGPDQVMDAKRRLLAASMSAAEYVADRAAQLRDMGAGLRVEPDDGLAQAMMNAPSPYTPNPGLPPFYPGDRSGVSRGGPAAPDHPAPVAVPRRGSKWEASGAVMVAAGLVAMLAGVAWGGALLLAGCGVFLAGRFK